NQVAAASVIASALPSKAPIPLERPDDFTVNAYVEEQGSAERDPLARIVLESAQMKVDPVHTASAVPANAPAASGGWVIQVASMPSKSEALKFLENMKEQVGKPLANAAPFTELF